MILAWAHGLTNNEIGTYLARVPGLGAVLYPRNYGLASEVQAIAYVQNAEQARYAKRYPFVGFIAGRDEPNVDGPSGEPLPASESRRQYAEVKAALGEHPGFIVPASLGSRGGFFRTLFHRETFDHDYQDQRGAPGLAWAATRTPIHEIKRVRIRYDGPVVLSPALFRGGWNGWLQPHPREFVRLSGEWTHVAIWSLEQVPHQPEFGLFDVDGRLTAVGDAVREAMRT